MRRLGAILLCIAAIVSLVLGIATAALVAKPTEFTRLSASHEWEIHIGSIDEDRGSWSGCCTRPIRRGRLILANGTDGCTCGAIHFPAFGSDLWSSMDLWYPRRFY